MVYLTNVQNEYELVYGDQIWDASFDGVTLEENMFRVVFRKGAGRALVERGFCSTIEERRFCGVLSRRRRQKIN